MQIVTDSGADLSQSQIEGLPIHFLPLRITLGDKNFTSGIGASNSEFYKALSETDEYPKTSQVSAGEFAALYAKVAARDPNILSIHISSGLSGTLNSAKVGAAMVPEANITFWDSKTLSAAQGWQVQAAGLAIKKGWPMEKILERLSLIRDQVEGMFTMKEMRYLIHGGRISQLKGLMATVLNIKPIIAVEHIGGTYINAGQEMTFKRAVQKMIQIDEGIFGGQAGPIRAQIVHGECPEGVRMLQEKAGEHLNLKFEEVVPVAPALGAHVGASLTGIIMGPVSLFADLLDD